MWLLCILQHLVQKVQILLLPHLSRLPTGVEVVQPLPVREGVVQQTVCWPGVPARPAALLDISFEGLRQGGVDDKADVFLVDAHAEGNGGDDDLDFVFHPVLVDGSAVFHGAVGVEKVAFYLLFLEVFGEFFGFFASHAIDDTGFALVFSFEKVNDIGDVVFSFLFDDLVKEVWTVETRLKVYDFFKPQNFANILSNRLSRRRSQTQHGHIWKLRLEHFQLQIILPKILPPVRHTMRLIYHKSIQPLHLVQPPQLPHNSLTLYNLFRCDVDQLHPLIPIYRLF